MTVTHNHDEHEGHDHEAEGHDHEAEGADHSHEGECSGGHDHGKAAIIEPRNIPERTLGFISVTS